MFSPVSSSSISFSFKIVGGQLLQVSPFQFPQARVQKSTVFLHPQLPPQPDLHLQNIIVNHCSGAGSWFTALGIKTFLTLHPHSVGGKLLLPSHDCTCKYTFFTCSLAASAVQGNFDNCTRTSLTMALVRH
jgi:hypothetical protein